MNKVQFGRYFCFFQVKIMTKEVKQTTIELWLFKEKA